MPKDQSIVRTPKEFSDSLTTELTDEEIVQAGRVIGQCKVKWEKIFRSKFYDYANYSGRDVAKRFDEAQNLCEKFSDEVSYRLADEAGVLATVDIVPIFNGEPPVIEIVGKIDSTTPFDHDKKEYEVKKAVKKDEAFLGEKESINKGAIRKRAKNES
jgi:hypothetical protein